MTILIALLAGTFCVASCGESGSEAGKCKPPSECFCHCYDYSIEESWCFEPEKTGDNCETECSCNAHLEAECLSQEECNNRVWSGD